MRQRTFIATSMLDAMEQVRAALGDDAIIISSIEGENGGFEVTATVESRSPTDPHDKSDLSLEDILRDRLGRNTTTASHAQNAAYPRERGSDTYAAAPTTDPAENLELAEDLLINALRNHSLPPLLMEAILEDANDAEMDGLLDCLAYALQKRFNFDALPIAPRHPILLAGLPGAGKTVSIAKLAARATIEGVRAEMISTDAERTGAAVQASAYGKLLQMNVEHADTIDALRLALDRRTERMEENAADHREAWFIDTPAVNPFNHESLKGLRDQIEAAQQFAAAEPILVLAAGGDARNMAETSELFVELGARRMIITQLDIARRLGGVLAAAEVSGLTFAQISLTPYLARGLVAATPRRLAGFLLSDQLSLTRLELD
ncbi:MAG: hypothetical protein RLN89_03705 [Parvibaculum sp.]